MVVRRQNEDLHNAATMKTEPRKTEGWLSNKIMKIQKLKIEVFKDCRLTQRCSNHINNS